MTPKSKPLALSCRVLAAQHAVSLETHTWATPKARREEARERLLRRRATPNSGRFKRFASFPLGNEAKPLPNSQGFAPVWAASGPNPSEFGKGFALYPRKRSKSLESTLNSEWRSAFRAVPPRIPSWETALTRLLPRRRRTPSWKERLRAFRTQSSANQTECCKEL